MKFQKLTPEESAEFMSKPLNKRIMDGVVELYSELIIKCFMAGFIAGATSCGIAWVIWANW